MNATQNLRTEASLYAEGTGYTTDELVAAYEAYASECEANGEEPTTCERWFAANYGDA